MGVMPCQRSNCDAILCDRYSDKYGYICNACFEELVDSHLNIEEFLETEKGYNVGLVNVRRGYLESEFKKGDNNNSDTIPVCPVCGEELCAICGGCMTEGCVKFNCCEGW